jgi:hypothetical protein
MLGDGFRTMLGTDSRGRHHFAFKMVKFNGESGPPMYARLDSDADPDLAIREPIDVAASGCTQFWIGRDNVPTAIVHRDRAYGATESFVMRRYDEDWHSQPLPAALSLPMLSDILEQRDGNLLAIAWNTTEEDAVLWRQQGTNWTPTPLRVKWPDSRKEIALVLRLDPQDRPVVFAIRQRTSPSWVRVIRPIDRR